MFLFATMVGIVRQNGRNARRRVFFLGSLNGAGRSSEAEPSGARRRDEERVEGREAGQRPGTRAGVMHSLSSCPKGAKNTRGAGRAKEHSITSITRSDNKVLVRGQYWWSALLYNSSSRDSMRFYRPPRSANQSHAPRTGDTDGAP